MLDTDKLGERIRDSGLKKVFIAEKLGLSYQGYLKKESGKSDFTSTEISLLKDMLKMSNKEVADIFLQ